MFIPPNVGGPSPRELETQRESRQEASPEQAVSELAAYVVDCLNHGSKPADIRRSLVAKGLDQETAREVVHQVLQLQAGVEPRTSQGRTSQGRTSPGRTSQARQGRRRADDEDELEMLRQVGQRNMRVGGIVCVVGVVITLISLASVSGGGGGVIAWGAIVFGGIQYFRGLGQVNSARE